MVKKINILCLGVEEATGPVGLYGRPTAKELELSATDLNPVEHQFVPKTVVTYNPTIELRLLSPHSVVKQSSSQRRGHRTQDLYRE